MFLVSRALVYVFLSLGFASKNSVYSFQSLGVVSRTFFFQRLSVQTLQFLELQFRQPLFSFQNHGFYCFGLVPTALVKFLEQQLQLSCLSFQRFWFLEPWITISRDVVSINLVYSFQSFSVVPRTLLKNFQNSGFYCPGLESLEFQFSSQNVI